MIIKKLPDPRMQTKMKATFKACAGNIAVYEVLALKHATI